MSGPATRGRRPNRSAKGDRPGDVLIGGRRAVAEAIRAGRANRVLVSRAARGSEGLTAIRGAAERAGLELELVDVGVIEELRLQDHQGVAAVVAPPEELDDRRLGSVPLGPDALVVVLDGVMDPQNFGACARSAEAAGGALLIVRKRRAAPLTGAAIRASAGALFHLPLARVTNIARAIDQLGRRGFTVVGLDHRAPSTINDAPIPDRPLALVVGAEDVGLSRLVREGCDQLVSIPVRGRMSSLNASAALAVALFAYALRPREEEKR